MQLKIKDIIDCLEDFAPLIYQENYDNCGLLVGDSNKKINKALLTLDCTEEIIQEAIDTKCELVIAHHPIIFKGLKKLTGKNYIERTIIKAIQNDIAIYAIHTNADNVVNGVNQKIAEKIGLKNCRILAPKISDEALLKKLVTFCPVKFADKVRNALFASGAGHIGNYSECSFNTTGKGTFKGSENTRPFTGTKNKQHTEEEIKIETIYPVHLERKIIKTLVENHPYEEVAYDIFPLNNINPNIGSGLIGELGKEVNAIDFLKNLKKNMQTDCVRHTKALDKKVKKVAICGGSGSFLLKNALSHKADVFVTGDFKYHEFFDAENRIIIADIGHYESEQFTKDLFYEVINKKFPKFAVRLSKINTNPINYL
jgi:dinuclear metal center YbgI/SA1388 family protein